MMSGLKILVVIISSLLLFILSTHQSMAFSLFGGPCDANKSGTAPSDQNATCQQAQQQTGKSTDNPITRTIKTAANIVALLSGIVAVIMIIIGGMTMVTSGGNAESVATARRRVLYSLIGLVVIALAWTLTRFITDIVIS